MWDADPKTFITSIKLVGHVKGAALKCSILLWGYARVCTDLPHHSAALGSWILTSIHTHNRETKAQFGLEHSWHFVRQRRELGRNCVLQVFSLRIPSVEAISFCDFRCIWNTVSFSKLSFYFSPTPLLSVARQLYNFGQLLQALFTLSSPWLSPANRIVIIKQFI